MMMTSGTGVHYKSAFDAGGQILRTRVLLPSSRVTVPTFSVVLPVLVSSPVSILSKPLTSRPFMDRNSILKKQPFKLIPCCTPKKCLSQLPFPKKQTLLLGSNSPSYLLLLTFMH